jgi:signal transduction histidine kinase/tetratricopeptide (TPR) repeat protein
MFKRILIFITLLIHLSESIQCANELKVQLDACSTDTCKLRFLNLISESTDDINVWPAYTKRALLLAQELVHSPDSAIRKFAEIEMARAYNNSGLYQNYSGNIAEAHQLLLQGLELSKKHHQLKLESEILHNLGSLYFDLGESEVAQQYFIQSKSISETEGDTISVALSNSYLGMVALRAKNYTQAMQLFNQAEAIFKHKNQEVDYYKTLVNIGTVWLNQQMPDSAIAIYKAAEALCLKNNDEITAAIIYQNLGTIYFQKGNIAKALDHAMLAQKYALATGFPSDMAHAELLLSKIYHAKKEYALAYEHLVNYNTYNERVKGDEVKNAIRIEQVKAGVEKQMALQKAEQLQQMTLAEKEISKQRFTIRAFAIIAVLLTALVLVLIYAVRQQTRNKVALQKAYSKLKETQQQLIFQEKNASLAQFTSGIAHEMKNPLNFISNFSLLADETLDDLKNASTPEEQKDLQQLLSENLKIIKNHSARANTILNNMLQHARSEKLQPQPTDIIQICESALQTVYSDMVAGYPGFASHVIKDYQLSDPIINGVSQDLLRVMINLLSNAFYSVWQKAKQNELHSPEVKISICELPAQADSSKAIEIKVYDNGLGISEQFHSRIFQPFFTTKPANSGTGLGLSITYDIIKAHGGNISFESKEGIYAVFKMVLPR